MNHQPLTGLKVVEFTHMVMGPTCGMILGDLGAEVIKVEPIDGDGTLSTSGAAAAVGSSNRASRMMRRGSYCRGSS